MGVRLLICCLLLQASAFAQITAQLGGKPLSRKKLQAAYQLLPGDDFSNRALRHNLQTNWIPVTDTMPSISHQPKSLWLKIPLKPLLQQAGVQLLHINNPHINQLKLWVLTGDSVIRDFEITGDHYLFNSRPIPATGFTFPLPVEVPENCYLILAADQRFSKFDLPLEWLSEKQYSQVSERNMLFEGFLLGMGCLIILINLVLFAGSSEKLYLLYGLYLLLIFCYFTIEAGLFFRYLYPQKPEWNDIIRPAALSLSMVPQMLFFYQLLQLKTTLPALNAINRIVFLTYIILFVIGLVTSTGGNREVQQGWIFASRIVLPIVLLILLTEAFYCVRSGIRFATFAFASVLCLASMTITYALYLSGFLPQNRFTVHALETGIWLDIVIIGFSLGWRYRLFQREAQELQVQNRRLQQTIYKETAGWQQKEMLRLSSLLHDNLGAKIGLLRLKADGMPLTETGRQEIADLITQLGAEVRSMSHRLSPVKLQEKGLRAGLEDLVRLISSSGGPQVRLEWIGAQRSLDFEYELIVYHMAQELLQNVLKHARATEGVLQIICDPPLISIYVEDNGIGSDESATQEGLGLKNISRLAELMNGRFRTEGIPGKGFSASVEFTL